MSPLWTGLTSLHNLFDAAARAAQGKKSRPDVAAFRANLEPELFRLQRQLAAGTSRPGAYARYVDDFLLFSNSKEQLNEMHVQIREFLYRYRLTLHPGKSRVYWCRDGFPFLGFRLFPTHARLVRPNVVRFRRRLRQLHADYHAGLIDKETVNQSVQAWIGHAMHGDTWRLREQIFEAFPFLALGGDQGRK